MNTRLSFTVGFGNKMTSSSIGSTMSMEALIERLRNESTCVPGWLTLTQHGACFAK